MPDTWGLARTAEGLFAHGEIDLATADPFEERASEAVMEAAGSSVLIDLSGVTFKDSAGMRALVRVLELPSGKSLIPDHGGWKDDISSGMRNPPERPKGFLHRGKRSEPSPASDQRKHHPR